MGGFMKFLNVILFIYCTAMFIEAMQVLYLYMRNKYDDRCYNIYVGKGNKKKWKYK